MGRLYKRQHWLRFRAEQLRQAPMCAMCLQLGQTVIATDVDHIKPLADGGEPYDFENVRSLCHSCHSRVTHAAQLGREVTIKGCDASGYPLDPRAWWSRDERKNLSELNAADRARNREQS